MWNCIRSVGRGVRSEGVSQGRESGRRRQAGGRLVYGWRFRDELRCEAECNILLLRTLSELIL
jgi:hypothetical protein